MQYKIGDIVFAADGIENEQKEEIKNHLYVIIDDDGNVVPADYFGFVVSSKTSKSKENSNFKFNESLIKNNTNNLKVNSIVKCDQLFSIPASHINKKIGTVEEDDMIRFLGAFNNSLVEV